jgi:transposase
MEERIDSVYVKRTQKDYSMSLKMQVIQEVERGEISLKGVQRKYYTGECHSIGSTFDWGNSHMPKSQEQKILNLSCLRNKKPF